MTLTLHRLQRLVASMDSKAASEERRWFGIQTRDAWSGPTETEVLGHRCRIVQANSPLAARAALIDACEEEWLVIVTPLDAPTLGLEFVSRLARRRLETIHPWASVRDQFQVSALDPRLAGASWMAEALLDLPSERCIPPGTGVLDLEHVWGLLLADVGIGTARPEAATLLEWGQNAEGVVRWRSWQTERRIAFKTWAAEWGGTATERIVEAIENGNAADLPAIGLVLDALAHALDGKDERAASAVVRAERFFASTKSLEVSEMRSIGGAAVEVLQRAVSSGRMDWVGTVARRADELFDAALRTPELAEWSDWVPGGLAGRLESFARVLAQFLDAPSEDREHKMLEQRRRLAGHKIAASAESEQAMLPRADMACRLARWLRLRASTGETSLGTLARQYMDDGAWADRARHVLLDGEGHAGATAVYRKLLARVLEVRQRDNLAFGEALVAACANAALPSAVMGIEEVLDRVLAPIAGAGKKVLLLVLDGMSAPIAQQIVETIEARAGWRRHVPASLQRWPVVLSTVPSVTEASRCSLLCGSLRVGAQAIESEGFEAKAAEHGWRKRQDRTAILFHKADLGSDPSGDLFSSLEDALESEARVIAAIVNAVDDQLAKGGQIRPDWSLAGVPVLERLVAQAEAAERVLVVTSDHGHVVESGSSDPRRMQEHERWHADNGTLEDGELRAVGPRVLLPQVGGPCVVPASEIVRYVPKRGGYHGGVTPQEVVVPLAVLVPAGIDLEGWVVESVRQPDWWLLDKAIALPLPSPKPAARPKKAQPDLFTPLADVPRKEPDWIGHLLASSTYDAQLKFAGRTPPKSEEMQALLRVVEAHNGTILFSALASELGMNAVQLNGRLIVARRVLNVDGYGVLELEDGGQTLRLNFALLEEQFQIRRTPKR